MAERSIGATLVSFDNISVELERDTSFWGSACTRAVRGGKGVVGDLFELFRAWFKDHPFNQHGFISEMERSLSLS